MENRRIEELQAEVDRLKSLNKEAMELLEAAVSGLKQYAAPCEECCEGDCKGCDFGKRWRWIHADRYELLKAQSTAPTKNTDGEE